MVNHFSGSGPASFSFFDGMSGGLAPPIPGQDGPTLEQLLSRNLKSWKPFTSDADFKEALTDWLDHVTQQLAFGGGDSAQLRATVSYITATLDYLSKYGHKVVYLYHKDVTRAMRKNPSLYDPLVNGPTYLQAFVMHLQSASFASTARPSRTSQSSTGRGGRRQAPAARDNLAGGAKRSRSDQQCDLHPSSSHTNGECKSQAKRQATGKPSAPNT